MKEPDPKEVERWRSLSTSDASLEDAAAKLLLAAGGDLSDPSQRETPKRVVKALREMTAGRFEQPQEILATTFDAEYDEMVVVPGIRFTSMCEHHMLPFSGTAAVAYIPNRRVVGLSKLPRLVLAFARRLQLQERLTVQVADAIEAELKPHGVGVVIRAHHSCMGVRGVRQPDAAMVTSALRGRMRDGSQRAEFLRLVG